MSKLKYTPPDSRVIQDINTIVMISIVYRRACHILNISDLFEILQYYELDHKVHYIRPGFHP